MLFYIWTPKGRKQLQITSMSYEGKVIDTMRATVRETAYHVCRLIANNHTKDHIWSRSCELYRMACQNLRDFDPNADVFITATYRPDCMDGDVVRD